MKYFFWIAFAVFLAASIPHVAYFFASFEPSSGPEGVWWWAVSYAIAISIDVTVYLLSWTAFQRYRKYRSARAVWQHWVLIILCTFFSWAVNWAYAKQFHNPGMLSSAEATAPWLTNVFPFMASAFPLLGIVYTMMAETIAETANEEKKGKNEQFIAISELAKQLDLPVPQLQQALASGSQLDPGHFLTTVVKPESEAMPATGEAKGEDEQHNVSWPITGQFVALEEDLSTIKESARTGKAAEGNQDKLQITIQALKARPDTSDEELAKLLSLKRPASARFWRLKATEILNATDKKSGASSKKLAAYTPSHQDSWVSDSLIRPVAAETRNGKSVKQ